MKYTIYIFFVFILLSSGCKKDSSSVVDPDTGIRSTELGKNIKIQVPEVICANEEFLISLEDNNIRGKAQIQVSIDNGKTWSTSAESSELIYKNHEPLYINLGYGNYKLRGCLITEVNGEITKIYSDVIERTVSECLDCDGLVLDPNLSGNNFLVHPDKHETFTVEFTVIACDRDYSNLKLTGRIPATAALKSASPENIQIVNNQVTWEIGDVKRGFAQTYKLNFSSKIPQVPYGTMIPITGGFALLGKTNKGMDVRVGDYNEIFVQVQ